MKKIVVASLNPVKARAVLSGFQRAFSGEKFTLETVSVESGVSDQPMSDQATLNGAVGRAQNARKITPDAHFWVGVEGGCDYLGEEMVAFAWIVVLDASMQGKARTGQFLLPHPVQALIESGFELGDADDQVFGRENSKQQSGAVGLLTHNVITRKTLYEHAVILALIPFMNQDLYLVNQ